MILNFINGKAETQKGWPINPGYKESFRRADTCAQITVHSTKAPKAWLPRLTYSEGMRRQASESSRHGFKSWPWNTLVLSPWSNLLIPWGSSLSIQNGGNSIYLIKLLYNLNDINYTMCLKLNAAAAAKSHQSCPTLCDPIDGSPPGSPVPGTLQARTLEGVAISFYNAWKKSESEVAQSCPTLSDAMDCSLPASSVHGILQASLIVFHKWSFRLLLIFK